MKYEPHLKHGTRNTDCVCEALISVLHHFGIYESTLLPRQKTSSRKQFDRNHFTHAMKIFRTITNF